MSGSFQLAAQAGPQVGSRRWELRQSPVQAAYDFQHFCLVWHRLVNGLKNFCRLAGFDQGNHRLQALPFTRLPKPVMAIKSSSEVPP